MKTNFETLVDETINRMRAEEESRQKAVAKGIAMGCESCSQWDGYWGCSKCENLLKGN